MLFFSTFSSTLAYFYLGTNGTSVGVESIVAGPPTQLSPGWRRRPDPMPLLSHLLRRQLPLSLVSFLNNKVVKVADWPFYLTSLVTVVVLAL